MKLPFTFEQFKKNPIKALLFVMLLAVGYLYVENRINYTKQIERCEYQYKNCDKKIEKLEYKLELMAISLRSCDSTLATASTRLKVLNELGLIP